GIKASFVFTKVNDTIYVSARSIDEVNVQLICERLGGGGHLSVAGVQMKDVSVEEAMTRVKDTIRLMTKEGAI
ncbi:MAG: DHH family phosphoesterase, partial [Lachnospiraceae bacterium]|nr:DHH family phosphoesterase [Lachnospiraceae bacterium]